jgi:hypothetical protein
VPTGPQCCCFFLCIAALSELSVYVMLAPVGLGAVWTLQTTLSVPVFEAQLADLFVRGVAEQYIAHYYYDFINPFWYSVLLALLLGRAMNACGVPSRFDGWALLPLLAGVLDGMQNLLHLYMVVDTANVSAALVLAANGAGVLKLCLLAVVVLAIIGLQGAAIGRRD